MKKKRTMTTRNATRMASELHTAGPEVGVGAAVVTSGVVGAGVPVRKNGMGSFEIFLILLYID